MVGGRYFKGETRMSKIAGLIENAHWDIDHVEEKYHQDRGTLCFNFREGRYHVWLAIDRETNRFLRPPQFETGWSEKSPILYKNPRLKADGEHRKRGDYGYFETKKLDATARVNAALIAMAIDKAGDFEGAVRKAKEKKAEKDLVEEAARRVYVRNQAMEESASELYDAVVGLLNTSRCFDSTTGDLAYRQSQAEAVLAKIAEKAAAA